MPIISSNIIKTLPQIDGRSYVTEQHIDDKGVEYNFEYLADVAADTNLVLTLRQQKLNAELGSRAAAELVANNFKLPISKLQFRNLFTLQERMAIDEFNVNFESMPSLTAQDKSMIRTSLEDYRTAEYISLANASTVAGVQLYETLGLIAAGRAAIILAS